MSWFVLATGLGVANFIIVALLFRRLRANLNRQLITMRAERNSEWILSALKEAGAPDKRESTAQAVNGNGFDPPPASPQPVRRKRHLGLFLGGGLAAALLAALQEAFSDARKTRHGQLMAGAVGITAAATAATLLIAAPWDHSHRPPSSAPTVTITPASPTGTPPPAPPPGSPKASTRPSPGATVKPSASPPPGIGGTPGSHLTPVNQTAGIRRRAPSSGTPGVPLAPPGQGSTFPVPPSPPPSSASPTSTQSPAAGGLCVAIGLDPLLALRLCPQGGG